MNSLKSLLFSSAVVCGTFCFAWFVVLPAQFPSLNTDQRRSASPFRVEKIEIGGDLSSKVPQTTSIAEAEYGELGNTKHPGFGPSEHDRIRKIVSAEKRAQAKSKPSRETSVLAGVLSFDLKSQTSADPSPDHNAPPNRRRSPHSDAAKPNSPHPDLQIPDICTADLPGLDFEKHQESLVAIRNEIRKSSLTREFAKNERDTPPASQHRSPRTQRRTPPSGLSLNESPANEIPVISPLPAVYEDQFNPHADASVVQNVAYMTAAANPDEDPHLATFSRTAFPSAVECKTCHEQIYREWSVSGHAYAAVSPMYQKFEQRINDLSQGTIGYFCMRCHAPVATTMELRRDQPIWDGPKVFREGVTCVACHRVVQAHGKDYGERRIEPGDISQPIVASGAGIGVEIAKKNSSYFKIKTDPNDKTPGQVIHRRTIQFDQLGKSTFCVSCHQVAVEPGISLEVVWNQYRASPAWRQGITCQDCHMGRVPGLAEGYSVGPAAIIDGKAVTADRKHSNHQFYGPGYSIAHPGVFPHNPDADKWTFNEWLQFDWRAGWGLEKFEEELEQGLTSGYFPAVWSNVDDRMDAREIIDDNLKLLGYKRDLRKQVMVNGAKVEGPFFIKPPKANTPLKFYYKVMNTNLGHNMPSGSLGAQPQLWLNVALIGPNGNRLWESGYLDSVGDLADNHSADVLARKIPHDAQLFNLQTKFLTTNVKGTDREMYLPINVDFDQLPFIRPDARPVTVMNHPPFIRMEGHSISATGSRNAKYKIPANLMAQPGCYRLSVRMRSRMEPIYFMKDVRATPEMIQAMNEGILDIHTYSKTFLVR